MRQLFLYIPMLLTGLFFSCHDSDVHVDKPNIGGSDEIDAYFYVRMPSQSSSPPTYAMDFDAENHLQTVDILAFEYNENDQKYYYSYKTVGTSIQDVQTPNYKTFNAKVIKKTKKQKFVIIGNAHNEVEDLGDIAKTGVKDEVIERLIFRNKDKWNASNPGNFTPIPMWCESGDLIISDATNLIEGLRLLRMVARIDVSLVKDAIDVFVLEKVFLYNRHTRGHIAPNLADEYWGIDSETQMEKIIKATIPADNDSSDPLRIQEPISYTTSNIQGTPFVQEIYTFEAAAVGNDEASKATCIVVGGKYDGSDKTTYYRLDFINKDASGNFVSYKDILRNHLYKVNIEDVLGPGYDNEEDAFNAKGINIVAEIIEWDNGDMGNIVFDGQYMLSVAPGEFTLNKEQHLSNQVKVFTDYPGGWKIDTEYTSTSYPWIQNITPVTGAENETITFTFDVEANPGAPRTGYIKIKAGRLSFLVNVTQNDETGLDLKLMNDAGEEIIEMDFPSKDSPYITWTDMEQELHVSWKPGDISYVVTDVEITDNFIHNRENPVTAGARLGGTTYYELVPTEMTSTELENNPFLEKVRRVDFTLNNGSSYIMKSVFLKQTNYTVVASDVLDSYETNGGMGTFTVKSNANWVASIENGDNPQSLITSLITTQGTANPTGEEFKFNLANDDSLDSPEAIITFTSPDGKFEPVKVTIKGASSTVIEPVVGLANCYMLIPGGDGISFPVAQANADGESRIKSGDILFAELLWTDSEYGMSSNGAVAKVSVDGTGPTAKLVVVPGKSAGNAVVAVRKGSSTGPIRWSWHIWVVDYDPSKDNTYKVSDNEWMDRNLGATSSTQNNAKTLGLYYQWGRKDPFPGMSAVGATTTTQIYNAAAQKIDYSRIQVTATKNLENSIENPVTFYMGSSNNYNDWYTNSGSASNLNNYLWQASNNVKTSYDPCPYGWRICYELNYTSPWQNYAYETRSWHNGVEFASIGYWPTTGYLQSATGTIASADVTGGYYWAGANNGDYNARNMYFKDNTTIELYSETRRGQGYAVRCVKN